jgi:hypothetical protein
MIRHLVLWNLSTDDPNEKAQIVAELTRRFSALLPVIDGTQRIDIRADLGDIAGNWDVVLDSDFLDAAALDFYQTHPAHLAVVEYVRSVVSDRACIDFEV